MSLIFSNQVYPTAVKIALIIGTILAFVNHYHAIFSLTFSTQTITQILMTYCVPYCVSTYSQISVILRNEKAGE